VVHATLLHYSVLVARLVDTAGVEDRPALMDHKRSCGSSSHCANCWSACEMYTVILFWTGTCNCDRQLPGHDLALQTICWRKLAMTSKSEGYVTQHTKHTSVQQPGHPHQSFAFGFCCHEQPYLKWYLARRMECSPTAYGFQVLPSVGGKWRNFNAYEPKAMVHQCEKWSVK